MCKNLLIPVVLGIGFAQDFRAGLDWNNHDQPNLHNGHKPLTYSKPNSSNDSTIFDRMSRGQAE